MKYEIYLFEKNKIEPFYKKAIAEYEKRLGRYCKISYKIIKKEKEWEKLWKAAENPCVLLPGENTLSSEELSKQLERWEMSGQGKITFFIPAEEEQEKTKKARWMDNHTGMIIHPSDFTMNTFMTAMILYEQIYRGYRIMHHHPYHK